MPALLSVTGTATVLRNIGRRTLAMSAGCNRGLRLAGLMLQRESQKVVPVNYGILKASAYTRMTGAGFGSAAYVGYTANYALYVHENVEMKLKGQPRGSGHKGKYWDPQGRAQPKFLEEPARRLGPQMRTVIQSQIRIA